MSKDFVHLRVHSSYSMLESTIKIDNLVGLVKNKLMPAVSLTDNGNLYGALEFAIAANKNGVKPIHGVVINIKYESFGKEYYAELLLLAKNKLGIQNLFKLSSKSYLENDRRDCEHITIKDLEIYHEGLIILSGYTGGIIGQLLLQSNYDEAKKQANYFKNLLGSRYYMEISRHGYEKEKAIEASYTKLASELSIALVATNHVLFDTIEMHEAHDVLLCIADAVPRSEKNRKTVSNQCYLKSSEEMEELFSDIPEAIDNTIHIAKRCSFMLETSKPVLPNFSQGNQDEDDILRNEAHLGLEKRLDVKLKNENISDDDAVKIKKEYLERLEYELDIICSMKFSGYFLIVSDFIKWSKNSQITVGPGRGSGAGSVVAWSLLITDLDPIKFGLLFERFLNPERVSMPDFDIDFCQEKREQVIDYVRLKYGKERVANIITFGKLQAKAVIKDVARVLGLGYSYANYLTELVPFNAVNPVTLKQAVEEIPELASALKGGGIKNLSGENELIAQVLNTALILEGLHRHVSVHAAGIVISGEKLDKLLPLYKDKNSDIQIIQYSMKYAELAGLVKFDFLGLQTLTLISKCVELIKNMGFELDINDVNLSDGATFRMLSDGNSTGVFQFESAGMKDTLRKLKPDCIGDLVALGALYRPGPMENIPTYVACKHKLQEPEYLHPLLKDVLKETYGVIVYQEQVMEIAKILAGYTLGASDLLRRAMGKKNKLEMKEQENIFISGSKQNGIDSNQAKKIFDSVAKFAGYGFNKSHAVAYAMISYQTAYLKANYLIEFLVTNLNLEIDDSDKILMFVKDALENGIKILKPDINQSEGGFTFNKAESSITFGVGAIKNVTSSLGGYLKNERNVRGKFKSILDFIKRVQPHLINKRALENLIKAGCFDSLHNNRNQLIQSVQRIISFGQTFHQEKDSNQFSFNIDTSSNVLVEELKDYDDKTISMHEMEVTNIFLSGHPSMHYEEFFNDLGISTISKIKSDENLTNGRVKLFGVVHKKDTRMSQRGRFVTIVMSSGQDYFEVVVYNDNSLKKYGHLINAKEILVATCDVIKDEGGMRFVGHEFERIDDAMLKNDRYLLLKPKGKHGLHAILEFIKPKLERDYPNIRIDLEVPISLKFNVKLDLNKEINLTYDEVKNLKELCQK